MSTNWKWLHNVDIFREYLRSSTEVLLIRAVFGISKESHE